MTLAGLGAALSMAALALSLQAAQPSSTNQNGVRSVGPDVIVGDLYNEQGEFYGLRRFGRVGDITAYSVGTVHCNPGSQPVMWVTNSNEHPVIGLNLYRLKDGRFEQIGMSWLMHTFSALSMAACLSDCQPDPDFITLGVHCSTLHGSQAGWTQANLSPRHDVNASTGEFSYPRTAPAPPATIGRRLQVHDAGLHPPFNPGAFYFIEAQDLTADDAQTGNGHNNASHRRVQVAWGGGDSTTYNLDFVPGHETQREVPAIFVWRDVDPEVRIKLVDITGEGHMILASKASDLGDGIWHYEYALYNMNSDRSAGSFTVPIPMGTSVSNLGFHDVDYHSFGAGNESFYDGTDWPGAASADSVVWSTIPFSENENGNAVRWGTTYNFRFYADRPPASVQATVGLFKPGTPDSINVPAWGPAAPSATITRVVSRKTCDLDLLPGVASEPRQGGISEIRITFDVRPACPGENAVEICAASCTGGQPVPYSGASVVACAVAGNDVVLSFAPSLENARSYRIALGPGISSIPGQYVDVRALTGDVNSDGQVNASDRSAVVGAWSGPGFTCETDIDGNGATNANDRSLVVGAWTGMQDCAPNPLPCPA